MRINENAPSEEKSDDSKDDFNDELERVFHHFPKCHIKILLGNFNAKLAREDIFKPTIGNDSLHQDSNDNGVRIVNFATSNNLVVKNAMFLHRNGGKYPWTSTDGKTHTQIDHILIDRRWNCSTYIQNFIQHPTIKVNCIYRGNDWGSSMWFRRNCTTSDHIFCSQIFEKKMEIYWSGTSTVYKLQEGLSFIWKRGLV